MGRGVSYPSENLAVVFFDERGNYYCKTCVDEGEEETYADDHNTCKRCDKAGRKPKIEPDYDLDRMDHDDCVDNLKAAIRARIPSLADCPGFDRGRNHRLGDEDFVLLENGYMEVGISQYCDRVSVWAIPQDVEEEEMDIRERAEYARQLATIGQVLVNAVRETGNEPMYRQGYFLQPFKQEAA